MMHNIYCVGLLLILFDAIVCGRSIVVSPPSSLHEFRQLAKLIVNTFDDPSKDSVRSHWFQSKLEAFQWNVLDKSLSEELTFKQYTSTVRRMRGKKYCLLVVKDSHGIDDSHDFVVGVVEMGMYLCPHTTNSTGEKAAELRPQPTIGVLCVRSTHRQKGIGLALVRKCEQVAADAWNDDCVFVDVDPSNLSALNFFEKCGYNSFSVDELVQMRNATLYRRGKKEFKPHYLLKKILDSSIKSSDRQH